MRKVVLQGHDKKKRVEVRYNGEMRFNGEIPFKGGYSTIVAGHLMSAPPKWTDSGDTTFSWLKNSILDFECAWLSTPNIHPAYLHQFGNWFDNVTSDIANKPNAIWVQRPALNYVMRHLNMG